MALFPEWIYYCGVRLSVGEFSPATVTAVIHPRSNSSCTAPTTLLQQTIFPSIFLFVCRPKQAGMHELLVRLKSLSLGPRVCMKSSVQCPSRQVKGVLISFHLF